ncbi:MAG TPA: diacylglycerol kinase family protein, partial [Nannocystis sp.]
MSGTTGVAMDVGIITNPNSKKNYRRPQRRRALEQAVGRYGVVVETRTLDELPKVVRGLREAGCRYFVCDGGDGTLHWVLNTLYADARKRAPADEHPHLPIVVPTNGGTVDFVARKAGLKGDAESIVRRLVDRLGRGEPIHTVTIDTCRLVGTPVGQESSDRAGEPAFDRVGLAAALGGVAQAFFDRFYALPKERGAFAIAGVIGAAAGGAIIGTLAETLAPPLQRWIPAEMRSYATDFFKPTRARVEVDGQELPFDRFASMQVGSIDINLAGVVRCFRHAREGGVLHFQALDTTPIGVVANVPNIVFGTPILGSKVYDDRARHV